MISKENNTMSCRAAISAIFAIVTILCAQPVVAAEKKDKEQPRQGPFAHLPPVNAGHLAKLEALGDDSWIELGSPAPDEKWGLAGARSWAPKMAYAPDLGGAFLFGQAGHGSHNDATGRFGDDLWFYHSASHRWICAYPGTDVRKPSISVNKDGIEQTAEGDLIPVATMTHGYSCIDYDPDTKSFIHMPQAEKMYQGVLEPVIKDYRSKASANPKNAGPWYYDTTTGKWNRKTGSDVGTMANVQPSIADLMFYLPTKKSVMFHFFGFGRDIIHTYNLKTNQWTLVSDGSNDRNFFDKPPASSDNIAYYDSKRHRIDYLSGGGVHWICEADNLKWREAQSNGPGAISFISTWTYDAGNDAGILMTYRNPHAEGNGVWIYDPSKNSWSRSPKPVPAFTENCNAFYDPTLNIHFVYYGTDNRPGTMWAYRYKKLAKKSKVK
jgi:hypothetical protein